MVKNLKVLLLFLFLLSNNYTGVGQNYILNSQNDLYYIDIENCSSRLIGNTGHTFTDMALDPTTQKLYGIDTALYEIDTLDGSTTLISNGNYNFSGITFSDDGTLYASTSATSELFIIDKITGNTSRYGNYGNGSATGTTMDITFYNGYILLVNSSKDILQVDPNNITQPVILGQLPSLSSLTAILPMGCSPTLYYLASNDIYEPYANFSFYRLKCLNLYPGVVRASASLSEVISTVNFDLGPDTVFLCENDSISLNLSYPGARYLWSDSTTAPEYEINSPGTYWVQVSIGDCVKSDTLTVKPVFSLNLGNDTLLCSDDQLSFDLSHIVNGTYVWSDNTVGSKLTVSETGTYWVQVSKNGCTQYDTIRIERLNFDPFTNPLADTVLCKDDGMLSLSAYTPFSSYLWSDGSSDSAILVTEPGIYWVKVSNQCLSFSDTAVIETSECECQPFVANAFTPNADNLNDHFRIYINCAVTQFKLHIFNRNGTLLFTSNDLEQPWDGKYQGRSVPSGVYIYKISYLVNGQKFDKADYFTVLR